MTKVLVLICACLAAAWPADRSEAQLRAADNSGVVLYLTLAPELTYDDISTYRGLSADPSPEEAMVTSEPSPEPQIAFIMAAFPPESTPELQVITFGVRYSAGIRVRRHGITPQSLPMATRDFPLSTEGIAIAIQDPDTSMVVEIGWIAIQADEPGRFELVPHPEPKMASRAVSVTPPMELPVAEHGWLGFGEEGYAPIPKHPGPRWGATCLRDSLCYELTRSEADYYRGLYGDQTTVTFLGERVSCVEGVPCGEDAALGACCLPDGSCERSTHKECVERGGEYQGIESRCETSRCSGAEELAPEEGTR